MTTRKTHYRNFEGKRFSLYATADTKLTASAVAEAARKFWIKKHYARITRTKNVVSPFSVWIRERESQTSESIPEGHSIKKY